MEPKDFILVLLISKEGEIDQTYTMTRESILINV